MVDGSAVYRDVVPQDLKLYFGEQVRALAGLNGNADAAKVIEAFQSVPRELFAGVGPWSIMSPLHLGGFQKTPDDHARHLYHCVLVSLDREAGINIGDPALWAGMFTRLNIPSGSRVLQVGAGSGYYSAILAHIVGPSGAVLGFEINDKIAGIGRDAIPYFPNLGFRNGNAATDLKPTDGLFDVIVAFAGVTHPAESWVNQLAEGGVMLLPVTGSHGWGAMCLFEKISATEFVCTTVGSCGFYPCSGARDPKLEQALDGVFSDRARLHDWGFKMTVSAEGIQYEADDQLLMAEF
ncbi:methyltransferase domain-containing protein [Rhizobium sp. CFBP 8762]|uniref:protein-L-isoaspartate O-methyltransferase family protein n=1 Tax=Rhizobium sp. CFBP 8762 TaxID=2775279 RepID=UPI0017845825|nr:methyltransferase domain-containing protein [Rhizobium sp. CFBP 8762]MBD8554252.1 methyltransferase domain-containing protein [Rhizobium sp. CFBP 8762]